MPSAEEMQQRGQGNTWTCTSVALNYKGKAKVIAIKAGGGGDTTKAGGVWTQVASGEWYVPDSKNNEATVHTCKPNNWEVEVGERDTNLVYMETQ